MSVINLDKQFQFNPERQVIIGGKTYSLVFNDALEEKLTNLQITMLSAMENLNKKQDKFVNSMSLDERKSLVKKSLANALSDLQKSLDDVLGKGEGERLYKYYHQSTYALGTIAHEIIKIDDEVNSEKKVNFNKKKKAVRDHYTKKRD